VDHALLSRPLERRGRDQRRRARTAAGLGLTGHEQVAGGKTVIEP
jgi:hypothetical protein